MSAPNPEKAPLPQQDQQLYPPPPGAPPAQQHPLQSHPLQTGQTENTAAPYSAPNTYFPPPPPGPPPNQQNALHQQYAPPPLHTNEQPIPDYNPANPHQQYAPPPASPLYNDPPSDDEHRQEHRQEHAQKHGWGARLTQMGIKAAAPINALANKMGSQSFLPTTMDKECEKAAQILKSFCKEGITSDPAAQHAPPPVEPTTPLAGDRPVTPTKQKKERGAIVKIPPKVIAKAKGLAIFTTARVGFQFSGATGSGVLIARLPDGSWSPPSGIQVHAVGAGFMIGVDIYDCVCVINSADALSAFMSTCVSLGPDVAVVAGPYGAGGSLDFGASYGGNKKPEEKVTEPAGTVPATTGAPPSYDATHTDGKDTLKPEQKTHKRSSSSSALKPVFSYVKSRGFYAGVQVDGTVVTERKEANAAFYGQKLSVQQILKGEVTAHGTAGHWPSGAQSLYEALKIAETQPHTAEVTLPTHPAPAHQQTQQVPGVVGVPLQRQENPVSLPIQHKTPAQQAGSTGPAAGTSGEALPAYVDDGVVRPGVGDNKGTYQ